MKNKFVYSVIRFVPDSASGEFVNIGAIAGSDDFGQWDIRSVMNQRRAAGIDKDKVLSKVMALVSDLQSEIAAAEDAVEQGYDSPITEAWLQALSDRSERVLQFSEPAPILAENVEEALNNVFEQLVTDPAVGRHLFQNKTVAQSALKTAYRSAGVQRAGAIKRNPHVRGSHYRAKFDFGIANGSVVQLASTWSFDLVNFDALEDEIKAWAWGVSDLRRIGGSIETDARQIEVPGDVDISVVYVPPRSADGRAALEEAMTIFADPDVKATAQSIDDVVSVADRARAALIAPH